MSNRKSVVVVAVLAACVAVMIAYAVPRHASAARAASVGPVTTEAAVAHDTSMRLAPDSEDRLAPESDDDEDQQRGNAPIAPPVMKTALGGAKVEQTSMGTKPAPVIAESFDGLGVGFAGPQGTAMLRNPSDNSLAVGPNHVVQIVNSRMAIFAKRSSKSEAAGKVLYGPVATNTIFKGFGGACETRLSGDAVVRYDQLADRWLFVLPVFQRGPATPDQPIAGRAGEPAQLNQPRGGQPGGAARLFVPPPPDPNAAPAPRAGGAGRAAGAPGQPPPPQGPYSMCYAVSTSADPTGSYYRYEFLRALFPDYPRPAVWPDGYYVPSSTGDNRISETVATQKHACVAERAKMLKGEPATEQCLIIENVNFLNNADIDGKGLPPPGAPNIIMAAGGRQLDSIMEDSAINVWQFHVDWSDPSKTTATGPEKIAVAPYRYLCDGQLTNCVPQPGTDRRLDAQGDKLMQRLIYRKVNGHESIIAMHSINTEAGAGGVRWYEFRLDKNRQPRLYQQGTYAPDHSYRWMPSGGMDKNGNIGIGYSYGDASTFTGQRFAGRLANDPLGMLTLGEAVLAKGEASQTSTLRWEDYTTTAMDPSDDCTFWYVGDYLKKDATSYSSRIGAFRLPGCR